MNVPGVATTSYPSKDSTNSNVLYYALGTFWTQLFNDREALKGLSIGQSEELIQRYYEFIDAVSSLSVKEVPELKRERWLPLKIRKSAIKIAPLLFLPATDQDVAYWGAQPLPVADTETDTRNCWLHYGETFQFGKSKRPVEDIYVVEIDPTIQHIPAIVNRVVAPSQTLVYGIDYRLADGKLYFNRDPFTIPDTMKYQVFNDAGELITYSYVNPYYEYNTDEDESENAAKTAASDTIDPIPDGTIVNEEEMLLWLYHAEVDVDTLYKSFGYIFDFRDPDPTVYKHILEKVVNLFVEGPTVDALMAMIYAFIGIRSTETDNEVLADAYTSEGIRFVVTDKRVYTASSFYNFSSAIWISGQPKRGVVLSKGTSLFDAAEYYDNVTEPGWWESVFEAPAGAGSVAGRAALPPYMFIGSYHGALLFENKGLAAGDGTSFLISNVLPGLVHDEFGNYDVTGVTEINFPFPADMNAEDVASFNAYLSADERIAIVAGLICKYAEDHNALHGSAYEDDRINPLDFIFTYFLKTNTALIKLKFETLAQTAKFMSFFKVIRKCLPLHVFLMMFFDVSLPQDEAMLFGNILTSVRADGSTDATTYDGWVGNPTDVDYPPPWKTQFGLPVSETEKDIRPFVIARSLDLFNRQNYGYGGAEYLENTLWQGADTIVADSINLSAKYLDGQDAANLPLIYPITGTVTFTEGSTAVTGSGTKFLKEVIVGGMLYLTGTAPKYFTISQIIDNTHLTLAAVAPETVGPIGAYRVHERASMRNTSSLILWCMPGLH